MPPSIFVKHRERLKAQMSTQPSNRAVATVQAAFAKAESQSQLVHKGKFRLVRIKDWTDLTLALKGLE